ncbi:leucine-rich repeat domain-containing protein [Mycoplasma sp. 613B]
MKKIFLSISPLLVLPIVAVSCGDNNANTKQGENLVNKKNDKGEFVNVIFDKEHKTFTLDLSKESITTIYTGAFAGEKSREILLSETIKKDGVDNQVIVSYHLKKIIFPQTLEIIEDSAFTNRTLPTSKIDYELQELDFSKATILKTIGNYAFETNKIKEIILPDSVTYIGKQAFANNQISKFVISENSNLKSIGISAFFNNEITSLDFKSNKLELISKAAFERNKITSVHFVEPLSKLIISKEAFKLNDIKTNNINEIDKEKVSIASDAFDKSN